MIEKYYKSLGVTAEDSDEVIKEKYFEDNK
jgi:hypothetical protein